MIASSSATRTGPKNGIERSTFHPGCRRASAIMSALAFGRSSSSESSCHSNDAARILAPLLSILASHAPRLETR